MARPSKTLLLAAALSLSALAHAALLPKPEGLAVDEASDIVDIEQHYVNIVVIVQCHSKLRTMRGDWLRILRC